MIAWKDGKVSREWASPNGIEMVNSWTEIADALDECVAALRLIVNTEDDGSWPHEYATQALRKIGVEP